MTDENGSATILVEIPSYKDKDILKTLESARVQAEYPERIYFAVCLQDDDADLAAELAAMNDVRLVWLKTRYARGACLARYLCQSLRVDEDFVLRTDAHMRFVKRWDSALISQWRRIGDPKGCITCYLDDLTPEQMDLPVDDGLFDRPRVGGIIRAGWLWSNDSDWPIMTLRKYRSDTDGFRYDRSASISGHYLFMPGSADAEVSVDPHMHHWGDELPYAIRLYTYGYNIYGAGRTYALHRWERKEIPEGAGIPDYEAELFEKVLDGYGAGSARSVDDYMRDHDMDLKRRHIGRRAREGRYDRRFREYMMEKDPKTEEKTRYDALKARRHSARRK